MNLPKTFSQTCDKPYDRHRYKLVDVHGDFVIFDNWEETQMTWWNSPSQFLSHIEVLDIQKKKSKGFV